MKKYSKICLLALILMLICPQYLLAKDQPLLVVPEAWKPQKIGINSLMDISGDYEILGEAAPGAPTYFMGEHKCQLYLDLMTGTDIRGPSESRKDVTNVHIEQKDCTGLELTFFSKDGVLAKGSISGSDKVVISCNREAFKIVETAVGGIGRTMDVDKSYYLSEDSSLILHSKYAGIDRSRIFFGLFWNRFNYEYLVRFNRVKP